MVASWAAVLLMLALILLGTVFAGAWERNSTREAARLTLMTLKFWRR